MAAQLVNLQPETFYDTTISDAERKPVPICSVYPEKVYITHKGRSILVPECRDGMGCAKSDPIGPGTEEKDYGNAQKMVLESITARDNAMDAIGLSRERINSRGEKINARTTSEWWERGYFVPAGDEPSEKEIAAARARLNEWARRWVLRGDDLFGQEGRANRVDYQAKVAARVLRVRRPWAEGITDVQQKTLCPSCRNEMNAGATKCSTCGDRFVYVNGQPVLERDAKLAAPEMPAAPPPQNQQASGRR